MIDGLIAAARRIGNGKVGHFGFSFGGNFAAASRLSGAVDAAVDLGGPVDARFEPENNSGPAMCPYTRYSTSPSLLA